MTNSEILIMFWSFVLFLFAVDLCSFVSCADVHRNKGESFSFKCPAHQEGAVGVNVLTRREVQRQVLYYKFGTATVTLNKDYEGRLNVSLEGTTLTSTIFNLQLNDAGAYWCSCLKYFEKCEMTDKGVFLLIKGELAPSAKPQHGMNDFLIPVTALTAGSVLLLLLLLLGVWLVPKIKKCIRTDEVKTPASGVYEVMQVHHSRDV